jgi:ribosome-binding ATPase
MRLGIIGLPQSGKATVFEALTQQVGDGTPTMESRIGTIRVPDERIDILSEMYKPKKTIYAQVEYFLPGKADQGTDRQQSPWTRVRDCDALIHVVRNFKLYGQEEPDIWADVHALDQELIISDLVVAEKRMERLELDQKRGRKPDSEEVALLGQCLEHLNNEIPLRRFPELAVAKQLRGFAFLSAKPLLVLLNNLDEDDRLPDLPVEMEAETCMLIRAKLEQELAQMTAEEAAEFLAEFNISESATDRVLKSSYALQGLISFFTVGEDEVRAWTIVRETVAVDAAEVIHSDIKKGFIRAEVLAYDDLMAAGSYAEARKQGTVRLEGKTYVVKDGDIVHYRFNV